MKSDKLLIYTKSLKKRQENQSNDFVDKENFIEQDMKYESNGNDEEDIDNGWGFDSVDQNKMRTELLKLIEGVHFTVSYSPLTESARVSAQQTMVMLKIPAFEQKAYL